MIMIITMMIIIMIITIIKIIIIIMMIKNSNLDFMCIFTCSNRMDCLL